jgi:hypothetical protein
MSEICQKKIPMASNISLTLVARIADVSINRRSFSAAKAAAVCMLAQGSQIVITPLLRHIAKQVWTISNRLCYQQAQEQYWERLVSKNQTVGPQVTWTD